jgi:hypothetical protein
MAMGTGTGATPQGNASAAAVHFRGGANKTMKIQREHFNRKGERGMATVIFIALLAIMMILVTAESRALFNLHREVKLLEQQQVKRLNAMQTNTIPVKISEIR